MDCILSGGWNLAHLSITGQNCPEVLWRDLIIFGQFVIGFISDQLHGVVPIAMQMARFIVRGEVLRLQDVTDSLEEDHVTPLIGESHLDDRSRMVRGASDSCLRLCLLGLPRLAGCLRYLYCMTSRN